MTTRLIIPPTTPPPSTTPNNANQFHEQWETVQRRLGAILMAFYHYPERYEDAVLQAAYAVAELDLIRPTHAAPQG